MMRIDQVFVNVRNSTSGQAARSTLHTIRSQPSWIARLAMMVFLIIIGLPILFLVTVALVAAIVVFGILAAANILLARLRRALPVRDGRHNVRVVNRSQ